MTIEMAGALQTGFERTGERSGIKLAGTFYVLGVLSTALSHTLLKSFGSALPGEPATSAPLALPVPGEAAALMMGGLWILNLGVTAVAIRTLVSDETGELRREFVTRRMGWVLLNLVIGSLAFSLVVVAGLTLLILPGIYLAVGLYLWNVVVAVEDETFVEGMRTSWELTEGNRLEVFIVGLLVFSISAILTSLAGIPSVAGLETVSALFSALAGAVTSVFGIATLSDVYRQLSG